MSWVRIPNRKGTALDGNEAWKNGDDMTPDLLYTYTDSPVGPLLLGMDDNGLRFLHFQAGDNARDPHPAWRFVEDLPCDVLPQLRAYFAGERRAFDVPLAPHGTTFQLEVWAVVQEIPYGQTLTYTGLAHQIGRPGAVRAVGAANHRNPLPLLIPCHRVLRPNGTLTGQVGGMDIQEALLALEKGYPSPSAQQLSLLG